ncbi:MAG: SRPBCC domain-containing protein [Myxococcota bacterium]|nr:SRPBCC domain-containing protein [Myxococcota bacterium]
MKLDIRFEEVFERPIDLVWRAVTDRRRLARWLMDNDFEARVGHKFTLRDPPTATWRGWVDCEVLELDPPRRMVWSWSGGVDGEAMTHVVFELRPEGSGTRLVLRHEGETLPAQRESLQTGWSRKMEVLSRVLGPDYARRVAFRAPRERVFDAIATIEGLQGWWTPLVSGSAATGGALRFEFQGVNEHITMRVHDAKRPSLVEWTCIEHTELEDWGGTKVAFDLKPRGSDGCELSFRHIGLTPKFECYKMCEDGWEHFLASLVGYVDRGMGMPFGADEPNERNQRAKNGAATREEGRNR